MFSKSKILIASPLHSLQAYPHESRRAYLRLIATDENAVLTDNVLHTHFVRDYHRPPLGPSAKEEANSTDRRQASEAPK